VCQTFQIVHEETCKTNQYKDNAKTKTTKLEKEQMP
jgi:hypothetical protein